VGATDTNGNTILNKGGTAIGRGAYADPTSIAIGAHAHARTSSASQQIYAPNGIVIGGGTVTNPTVNNYGAQQSPPTIKWTQASLAPNQSDIAYGGQPEPGQDEPGVLANVQVNGTFADPAFIVRCSVPCISSAGAAAGMVQTRLFGLKGDPDIAGVLFISPAKLLVGDMVTLVFRSKDDRPVSLITVEAYMIPTAQ
jgi:hypothetical protein